MLKNVVPVVFAKANATAQVRAVHVTKGCTTFVNFFGNRAPKTKFISVVLSINNAVSGLDATLPLRVAKIAAAPLAAAEILSPILRLSENGFPLFVFFAGVDWFDSLSSVEETASAFLAGKTFLTATTVKAVDNRVK